MAHLGGREDQGADRQRRVLGTGTLTSGECVAPRTRRFAWGQAVQLRVEIRGVGSEAVTSGRVVAGVRTVMQDVDSRLFDDECQCHFEILLFILFIS